MSLRFLLLIICFFGVPQGWAQKNSWKSEVQSIDDQLQELEDLKARFEKSARKHEEQASRWQFQQNHKIDARRAYAQAELDRETVHKIQQHIDYLQAKKSKILSEHP